MPDAEIEEQEPRRRDDVLPRALRPGGHPHANEHVLEQLVMALDRRLRDAGVTRQRREVEPPTRLDRGELEEARERAPVLHERLAPDLLLEVDRRVGAQELDPILGLRRDDARQVTEREPLLERRGLERPRMRLIARPE